MHCKNKNPLMNTTSLANAPQLTPRRTTCPRFVKATGENEDADDDEWD